MVGFPRAAWRRAVAFVVVAGSLGFLVASQPAQAAGVTDSHISVDWADNGVSTGTDALFSAADVKALQLDHTETKQCYYTTATDGHQVGDRADATSEVNDEGSTCLTGSTTSGHWDDFKNLKVSVDKTAGLQDQAVKVTVTGLTTTFYRDGSSGTSASNFVQLMQCWGDPLNSNFNRSCQLGGAQTDKLRDAGLANYPYVNGARYMTLRDRAEGESAVYCDSNLFLLYDQDNTCIDYVPFVTVQGKRNVYSKEKRAGVWGDGSSCWTKPDAMENPVGGCVSYSTGLSEFFTASTTNEMPAQPVTSAGTSFSFEVQTSIANPYLGCGDGESRDVTSGVVTNDAGKRLAAAGLEGSMSKQGNTCYLTIVPRGMHANALPTDPTGDECTPEKNRTKNKQFGGTGKSVGVMGSPISPTCLAWADRMVIPLNFADTKVPCAAGAAEQRIGGTELMADAMYSWQRTLCAQQNGTLYSYTASESTALRGQVLNGTVDMDLTQQALTASSVPSPDALEGSDMQYAPVGSTGLVIGFLMVKNTTKTTSLKLTPRLLAKLLTQSYRFLTPNGGTAQWNYRPWESDRQEELYTTRMPDKIIEDPEYTTLNPGAANDALAGDLVLYGPSGEDAIRELWRYIRSDADAKAFLAGKPDPWGHSINPSWLPTSDPDHYGSGLSYNIATDDLSTLPLNDAGKVWGYVGKSGGASNPQYTGVIPEDAPASQILDVGAMYPYQSTFAAVAERVFKADAKVQRIFDIDKYSGGVEGKVRGQWSDKGPQFPAMGQWTIGATTASATERLNLTTASLALPKATAENTAAVGADTMTGDASLLAQSHTFVTPTSGALAAGAAALSKTEEGTYEMDYAKLAKDQPKNAYPLTMTISAAVNMKSQDLYDEDTKERLADFLTYAATSGQVPGDGAGELPDGYTPLTYAQSQETLALAAAIRANTAPASTDSTDSTPSSSGVQSASDQLTVTTDGTETTSPVNAAAEQGGSTSDGSGSTSTPEAESAAAGNTTNVAKAPVGAALVVGAGGMLGSTFMFRRVRRKL